MKNLFKFIKQKQQLPPNHHRHIALTLAERDGAISDDSLRDFIGRKGTQNI